MNTFFITGLPRSRTAWLANFLTQGDSFCFHEALRMGKPEKWPKIFSSLNKSYVGTSDSGLSFFAEEICQLFPKAPWVVIKRDPESCFKGVQKLYPDSKNNSYAIEKTLLAIEALKMDVFNVDFDDLNNMDVCRDIQAVCTPNVPFDAERWKILDGLTVEIKKEKYPIQPIPEEVMQHVLKKLM